MEINTFEDIINVFEEIRFAVGKKEAINYEPLKEWYNSIYNKQIPKITPSMIVGDARKDTYITLALLLRERLIQKFGHVLIDKRWLKKLVDYIGEGKCLEIGAGCGSLSFGLRELGVDIIATDNKSSNFQDTWCEIESIDAIKAMKKYGKDMDFIIISWAIRGDLAYNCLQLMRAKNPECKMIFIGEANPAVSADSDFYRSMKEVASMRIPNYIGMHDKLIVVE